MTPAAERLLELTLRPFSGNAENRLSAEAVVRESLTEQAADTHAIAEATESLERADRRPRWRYGWAIPVVLMLLVSVPLIVISAREVVQLRRYILEATSFGGFDMDLHELPSNLLLFGDRNAGSQAGKWKPLWDSDPTNPVYFAEYVRGYYQDHSQLSPEILAEAAQLDPENGWFQALDLGGRVEKIVTKKKKPSPPRGSPAVTPEWEIKDESGLRELLAGIHEVAGKSKFADYQKELLRQRIPLLPQRQDVASQLPAIVYLASQNSSSIGFRRLADALAAGAQQAAAQGDVAGFHQIVSDSETLQLHLVKNGTFLVDLLVAKVFAASVLNFRDAARDLGLADEEKRFSAIHDLWKNEKAAREAFHKSHESDMATMRGSMMNRLMLPMLGRQVMHPPELTEADLRPGRLAEFSLFERLAAWAGWLVLGFCACFASGARFAGSRVARGLSARMVDLLRPSDWGWIVLGGILFPLAWYVFFTRFTPLSARDWSLGASTFLQFGGQFGCLILSLVALPGLLVNWRLKSRGGAVLGVSQPNPWLSWSTAVLALLGVPVFGAMMLWPQLGNLWESFALSAACVAGIWLLVGIGLQHFGRSDQGIRRAAQARVLRHVWVFSMLILAISTLLDHAEERYWIQRDPIYRISADHPSLSRYEYDVTQILRGEVLDLIEQAKKIQ